jgi:hypothetical protein
VSLEIILMEREITYDEFSVKKVSSKFRVYVSSLLFLPIHLDT